MKFRLLFISVILALCTSFLDAADLKHADKQSEDVSAMTFVLSPETQIGCPEQNVIIPRQSDFTSHTQTRTVSKRQSNNRLPNRYVYFTAGRTIDCNFVKTYLISISNFPSGLMTPFRHHLSLGVLII